MISFTFDVPSNYTKKKLPILDLNVYLDKEGIICHEFYEKPTNSNFVILASSALSIKTKRTVFTQECLRRLRNTSIHLGPEVANHFLSKYMLKLKDSGYSSKFRSEIVKSAKNAFKLQIENDEKGIRPLFRDKARIIEDQKLRGKGRVDWWNLPLENNPDVQKYTSVLFVPPTPRGELAKLMQSREAAINSGSSIRIKVVESGGPKLKSILVNHNPYPKKDCRMLLCPFCKSTPVSQPKDDKKIACNTPGVGYQIDCKGCQEIGVQSVYIGESGRPAVNRGVEHVKAIQGGKENHPIVKHLKQSHKNKKVTFEFAITGKFSTPLARQADEALRISNSAKKLNILNSKSEFNSAPIARRITVDK